MNIKILDREYSIGCDDGQEPKLLSIAASVDRRLRQIRSAAPAATDSLLMVMLMLMQADENQDLRQDMEKLRTAASKLLETPEEYTQMALDYQISARLNKTAEKLEAVAISGKKR